MMLKSNGGAPSLDKGSRKRRWRSRRALWQTQSSIVRAVMWDRGWLHYSYAPLHN